MPFSKVVPEWNQVGVEPPQTLKDSGWGANQKPPADYFNWFFNTVYLALQELQNEAINEDQIGVANGIASLDSSGDLPIDQADNILNWVKGYGLGDIAQQMPDGTDFNTLDSTGFYKIVTVANNANAPTTQALTYAIINIKTTSTSAMQLATQINGNNIYLRLKSGGVWGVWVQLATYDSNGKIAIANLPAATTAAAGIVQLVDSITDTSTNKAATANSVKLLADWVKSFGLGDIAKDITGTDLNSLDSTGFYRADRLNVGTLNTPTRITGDNAWIYIINFKHNTTYKKQIAYDFANVGRWERTNFNSSWSAWTQIAAYDSSGKVAAANLPSATTGAAGIAQLSDSTSDTSTTKAATANSIKLALDWVKSYGLGDVAKDITSTDLNILDATGFYKGSSLTNAPTTPTGDYYYIINMKHALTYKSQIALLLNSLTPIMYQRTMSANVWGAWQQIATQDWVKGFGLGDVAKDISSTDLNALDATGFYRGSSLTNCPDPAYSFYIMNFKATATVKTQIAIKYASGTAIANEVYTRQNTNGTWTAWTQIASQDWVKSFGLGGPSFSYSGDLNALTATGFYYAGSSATNKPGAANGWVMVEYLSSTYQSQKFIDAGTGNIYYRTQRNGVWFAWTTVATQDWIKGFGLGTTGVLVTDPNTIANTGFYTISASTGVNVPNGNGGVMMHVNRDGVAGSGGKPAQLYFDVGVNDVYTRMYNGTAWGAWRKLATTDQEAWTNLTLQNSWVSYAGYSAPSYRKNNFGQLELRGVMKSGVTTAGTAVAVLPAGYRPAATKILPVMSNNGTTDIIGRIDIDTSGNIVVRTVGSGFISLDGIPPIALN